MSEELKPCPFCGGPAEIQTEGRVCRMIGCSDCGGSVGAVDLERGYWMWDRRAPAEQPAPVSTGREPVMADGKPLSDYLESAAPETMEMDDWTRGYEECKRRLFGVVGSQLRALSRPVAARELDVEAERREFEALIIPEWSRETEIDGDGDTVYVEDWMQGAFIGWQLGRAARSAAQGTQPESAQVSTEQAGDAAPDGWIAVAAVQGELTSVAFRDEKTARAVCAEGEPFPFWRKNLVISTLSPCSDKEPK